MKQEVVSELYANGVKITLSATDEGNAYYYDMPSQIIVPDNKASQYLTLHTAGKADKIKILIQDVPGKNIVINDISLNAERPVLFFRFSCGHGIYAVPVDLYFPSKIGILCLRI